MRFMKSDHLCVEDVEKSCVYNKKKYEYRLSTIGIEPYVA